MLPDDFFFYLFSIFDSTNHFRARESMCVAASAGAQLIYCCLSCLRDLSRPVARAPNTRVVNTFAVGKNNCARNGVNLQDVFFPSDSGRAFFLKFFLPKKKNVKLVYTSCIISYYYRASSEPRSLQFIR